MSADTYFIVELKDGAVRLFVEPIEKGGSVEFFSESEDTEHVVNINGIPFQSNDISVPGRGQVNAPVKRALPVGDWTFRMSRNNKLKFVGIEDGGVEKSCISVYQNELRVRQNLVKKNGESVTVGVLKHQAKLDVTVYFHQQDGGVLTSIDLPVGKLYGETTFKVTPKTRWLVVNFQDDQIDQTGGTEQGDLVIRPPSGN